MAEPTKPPPPKKTNLPPWNFTLGTMESGKFCSLGNWQNHACPLDCQMEKLDSSLQWTGCVLYTTALLGILLVKPLWPMYVGERYPWDEQVFSFYLRVWLGLECTGMPGLEKLSWISLINLLQQGWQCCSICYSVSPWLISDLLSCASKSFLYVCVSFLSVLPKRECVLPGVAQSWLPQESRLPTLKNKINQTLKELRTRPCKNLEEELATLF